MDITPITWGFCGRSNAPECGRAKTPPAKAADGAPLALLRRIAGSRVLMLGAGGSARAVAFALARGGANVCVCARRISRARALARAVGGEAIERRRVRGEFFDAIVNATPVGMFPRVGGVAACGAGIELQVGVSI